MISVFLQPTANSSICLLFSKPTEYDVLATEWFPNKKTVHQILYIYSLFYVDNDDFLKTKLYI